MLKLIKATTIVSMATIVGMAAAIIRSKFMAVTLNPAGVGIFAQANNFQQLLVTISTLGISVGIVKYTAKYRGEKDAAKIEGVISCGFWMQSIVCMISFAAVVLCSAILSRFLFSDHDYKYFLIIASVGMPFLVIASLVESVLFGYGGYKAFAKARSFSAVLSLIPLIILVYLGGIKGGFVFLAASGIITLGAYLYFLKKTFASDIPVRITGALNFKEIKNNIKYFSKDLLYYGGVSFAGGILGWVNIVFLRSLLIKHYGAQANGYYQVVFSISAMYLVFLTNGLWSHLYPKISAISDPKSYSLEVNNAIRFCAFGIMPFMIMLFLFRDMIINLVYSHTFIAARELFAPQLFGDMFYVLFYTMGISLLANMKLLAHLTFSIVYSVLFIGFFLILNGAFGIKAITISYLVSNALIFIGILVYHAKKMNLEIYGKNVKLLIGLSVLAGVILFLGDDSIRTSICKVLLFVMAIFLLTTKNEKDKIGNWAANKYKTVLKHAD